ncbi:hypothetical protein [Candidatus Palauibacter sp.]|uniref:hypothetical protein n=1 Tax=Candidatus Palauibacter sp. TaxID=3101350 RepID=UPI003AF2AD06
MFRQYSQNHVNEPILLHEGTFRVRAGDYCVERSGAAHLRWLPSPGIEFDVELREPEDAADFDSLTLELPKFRTEGVLVHSMSLGSNSRIRALASSMESGGEQSLLSAGFQVANFTNFITPGLSAAPGDPTAITDGNLSERRLSAPPTGARTKPGQSFTKAAAELRHDGWKVSLVAVPESRDLHESLKANGGYAFTHVGQLKRIDGSSFSVERAKEILESLRVFLSFARGAACSLPIRWGCGIDSHVVWRQFASPIVDHWQRGHRSWFDERHGRVLAELFDEFCRVHMDERLGESLVLAVHWYRHCNTRSSGMEGSIVLGMAALELLGGLIVVDRNGAMSAQRYDKLPGAKKLQELLSALEVQADIPQKYEALTRFAQKNSNWDSCQALAKLRNGFVHANEGNRRIAFGEVGKAATYNAWQLSLWYQELALLHLLKHCGSYRNRTTAEWVGQVESVPWRKL